MNMENARSIEDCRDELRKIETWINKNPLDSNVKFLVAYAVVKSSGTIEVVYKRIIHSFLSEGSKKETQSFLEKSIIDASSNPTTGLMEKYIEKFDSIRKENFSNSLKNSQEKTDLNSLVSLRNDIAHGRDISVSISIVKKYYESGIKILNKLEDLL